MTTTHEDARRSLETSASRTFREVLFRSSPEVFTGEEDSPRLVALLDDGTLLTVATLDGGSFDTHPRSIWSDSAWTALAQRTLDRDEDLLASRDGRILIPITVNAVLYGAIEWSGDVSDAQRHRVQLDLAAAELTPLVEAAILR